ncbi:MAG: VWA domain-containing protein [Vicinamibacteria bacterium]
MTLVALALGVFLSSTAQDQPRTPPVFGVEVENVYIDAFVSSHGVPVTGLKATDFKLRDNGTPQVIELAASDTHPLLAVLAFDVSGSVDRAKLTALRAASHALLESLRPEDKASLFGFGDDVSWAVQPTTDKAQVRQAIEKLVSGGGTTIMDALYAALTLPKSPGRSLVVLFTDGFDNLSWLDWRQIRSVAERSNAVIHVVSLQPPTGPKPAVSSSDSLRWGIYSAANTSTLEFEPAWALRQIAEATGGRYWEAESLDRLKAAFTEIAEAMGKRYILRYAPEGVTQPGWHKVELRLKGRKAEVRTRAGYWVTAKHP